MATRRTKTPFLTIDIVTFRYACCCGFTAQQTAGEEAFTCPSCRRAYALEMEASGQVTLWRLPENDAREP